MRLADGGGTIKIPGTRVPGIQRLILPFICLLLRPFTSQLRSTGSRQVLTSGTAWIRVQPFSVRIVEVIGIVSPHEDPLDFKLISQIEIDAFLTGQHFTNFVDTG